MGPTPVKSLWASAVIINRTAAQDVGWVQRVEATKERLRQQQGAAQAMVGASGAVGSDPTVQGL
jgi:hypothetical protein